MKNDQKPFCEACAHPLDEGDLLKRQLLVGAIAIIFLSLILAF